uniref:WD_REPEATS_REGION domain-containing protein n=1 Tax=Caenorhabditis tropicalis TaxID=1561998 RepID=A0A1I7U4C5_9PELO
MPAGHTDTINTMTVIRSGMVLSGGKDGMAVLTNTDSGEIYQGWNNETEVNKICYRNYVARHSLIAGGRDGSLKHWMFSMEHSKTPNAVFIGHKFGVTGLVNISETHFVSGSRDCSVRLWDLQTTQCVRNQTVNRNLVTHMAYNCAKNLIAQTSEDKSVKIWDPRSLTLVTEFPRKRHIQMFCEFDGDRLFSCSNGFNNDGCEITSYDIRNPRLIKEVRGHEGNVTCLAILQLEQNKRTLVSVSSDKQIRGALIMKVFKVLKPIWNQDVPFEADNLQVCTYPDGHIIVSGGKGRLIHYQAKFAAQRVLLDVQLTQTPATIRQSTSFHSAQ